jgi:hypothetical protein
LQHAATPTPTGATPPAATPTGATSPEATPTGATSATEATLLPGATPAEAAPTVNYSEWAAEHACRATLQPGDMLYIPVFWLHAVHGFHSNQDESNNVNINSNTPSGGGSGSNVLSINMWFKSLMELNEAIEKQEPE